MASYYRQQLENFLRTQVNVKAETVIDLGGGQKHVKGRTNSWEVKNYHVLDLPEYDVEKEIKFDHKADILFCLEVFEYLIIPTMAMKNIYNLLKPGGKAYVSYPLVYPLHNEIELDSLRYTQSGIKRMADYAKLKIDKVNYRYAKTSSLVKFYNEDGMRAVKGKNHNVTGYIVEFKK